MISAARAAQPEERSQMTDQKYDRSARLPWTLTHRIEGLHGRGRP
jgi:hypothetical protein